MALLTTSAPSQKPTAKDPSAATAPSSRITRRPQRGPGDSRGPRLSPAYVRALAWRRVSRLGPRAPRTCRLALAAVLHLHVADRPAAEGEIRERARHGGQPDAVEERHPQRSREPLRGRRARPSVRLSQRRESQPRSAPRPGSRRSWSTSARRLPVTAVDAAAPQDHRRHGQLADVDREVESRATDRRGLAQDRRAVLEDAPQRALRPARPLAPEARRAREPAPPRPPRPRPRRPAPRPRRRSGSTGPCPRSGRRAPAADRRQELAADHDPVAAELRAAAHAPTGRG